MSLGTLRWEQFAQADYEARRRWIDDLGKNETHTEVARLDTRIDVTADHMLIRPGQRASVVASCARSGSIIDQDNFDVRRRLLSISFDTLSDWHIIIEPSTLKLFNNRVSGNPLIKPQLKHEDLPPHALAQCLGVTREYSVTPDFQDISDRVLERIAFLKKMLIGDPDNPRLADQGLMDDVLNAMIFLRFLEDCENAKGNGSVDLVSWVTSNSAAKVSDLVLATFAQLNLPTPINLFRLGKLKILSEPINSIVLDWLPTSYRDKKQGCYEYDMGLIADHSIGQIYDKYISLVSYHVQNGRLSFFPEYDTELLWQRGTGLLYTPEFIARFLVNQVLQNFNSSRWCDLKVGDLACGSGVFLRNFLLKLHSHESVTGGISSTVLENLEATDINNSAVAAAKLSIAMTAYKYAGRLFDGFKPHVANSLSAAYKNGHSAKKLDVILMNPPFKGYEQQSEAERRMVAEVLGDYAIGKPDYSLAFVKAAFDRLNEGGCLGIVLPASFIDGKYAQKIRKVLLQNGDIQVLAKFEEYSIFKRGETQIAIMVFRKRNRELRTYATNVLYCRRLPDLALRAVETENYDTKNEWELFLADSRKWGADWPLVPKEILAILERLNKIHVLLSKVFDVRQGIRMGRKGAFLVPSYQEFPLDEHPILVPVADDENLYDARIHSDERRLIYAYDRGQLLSLSDMRSKFPLIRSYLRQFEASLTRRARMQKKPIWALAEPRDYKLMFSPKIVSTHFGVEGSYAFDKNGKYAVTNGNLLIAKREFQHPDMWYYYLAILNSKLFMRLVSRKSVKLKGGQYDLDERYTKNIPIPSYDAVEQAMRNSLSRIGHMAHAQGLSSIDQDEYENVVLMAYQLDPSDVSIL
ncbi:MAG: N-6 DNA methylase [Candidatus Zixiibacteriota bacterium]